MKKNQNSAFQIEPAQRIASFKPYYFAGQTVPESSSGPLPGGYPAVPVKIGPHELQITFDHVVQDTREPMMVIIRVEVDVLVDSLQISAIAQGMHMDIDLHNVTLDCSGLLVLMLIT